MQSLANHGAGHWPELNLAVPSLSAFKNMDFLKFDGLSLKSYDDLEKVPTPSKNDVYYGVIDGNQVVIKSHDLTGTTVQKVEEEVQCLHRLRHPNIISYQAVFIQRENGSSKMYIQMPRLPEDLKQWLNKEEWKGNPPAIQRKKIMLGVLRGVARIHEFKLTHNDIKLDNILIDHGGEAVLTDFEMCREETGGTISYSVSRVGGTLAYMAPERQIGQPGEKQPTLPSDMFSVGVVLLMSFSPASIKKIEARQVRAKHEFTSVKRRSIPKDVHETLDRLLAENPQRRPSAREVLEQESGFFARAAADQPSWWSGHAQSRYAVPVTDPETLDRLRSLVEPTKPDEFGLGLDKGAGWEQMGFERELDASTGQRGPLRIPADCSHAEPGSTPSVEMVRAWRLQNKRVWQRYDAGVGRVSDSITRGPPLDNLPMRPDKMNLPQPLQDVKDQGFCAGQDDRARQDVNETFLMHGIPKQTLLKVMTNGLNEHFAGGNKGSLFGEGIYFGENVEKVDQYTGESDRAHASECSAEEKGQWMDVLHEELYLSADDHPGDVCYILVCRVAMGYSIRTNSRVWNSATGSYEQQCVALDGEGASANKLVFATNAMRELVPLPGFEEAYPIHYHSLIVETGGNVVRFREFVVMHGDYIYPEYIVAYRRVIIPPHEPARDTQRELEPEPEPEPEPQQLATKQSVATIEQQAGLTFQFHQ